MEGRPVGPNYTHETIRWIRENGGKANFLDGGAIMLGPDGRTAKPGDTIVHLDDGNFTIWESGVRDAEGVSEQEGPGSGHEDAGGPEDRESVQGLEQGGAEREARSAPRNEGESAEGEEGLVQLEANLICRAVMPDGDAGCGRVPDEISEYQPESTGELLSPRAYVMREEGTLNRQNGHFLCTSCYIKAGQPSSPWGWTAP